MATGVVTEEDVKRSLQEGIGGITHLVVMDITCGGGCGAKFDILVVSPEFEGVGVLNRQRKVHAALGGQMKMIHGLTIKAWTPTQYEEKKSTLQ